MIHFPAFLTREGLKDLGTQALLVCALTPLPSVTPFYSPLLLPRGTCHVPIAGIVRLVRDPRCYLGANEWPPSQEIALDMNPTPGWYSEPVVERFMF